MTSVLYLCDQRDWALESIGRWLAESLEGDGIRLEILTVAEWRRAPRRADVIYAAFSTILLTSTDLRGWCDRLVTTVHDPCELSRFDDCDDWRRLPMRPHQLHRVDAVSAISAELCEVLRDAYDLDAVRTPTWSPQAEWIRTRRRLRVDHEPGAIQAFSSSKLDDRLPVAWRLRRLIGWPLLLRDQRGRLDARQLAAVLVRRSRKRVDRLHAIADAVRPDLVRCRFVVGDAARRPWEEYAADLLASDVYVCTSTMEGGPLPVLEAVMAGVVVLSTPVGQVSDWVEDGRSGYLCRTVDEFVTRLHAYATDRDLLAAHRARAREIADALQPPDIRVWRRFLLGHD
ncbi:MAG TPA: glycosyltransferase [Gemmatimonadales bacterium]|nr:glycosyltransferase [Gemmatimonadales bacterium]